MVISEKHNKNTNTPTPITKQNHQPPPNKTKQNNTNKQKQKQNNPPPPPPPPIFTLHHRRFPTNLFYQRVLSPNFVRAIFELWKMIIVVTSNVLIVYNNKNVAGLFPNFELFQ